MELQIEILIQTVAPLVKNPTCKPLINRRIAVNVRMLKTVILIQCVGPKLQHRYNQGDDQSNTTKRW